MYDMNKWAWLARQRDELHGALRAALGDIEAACTERRRIEVQIADTNKRGFAPTANVLAQLERFKRQEHAARQALAALRLRFHAIGTLVPRLEQFIKDQGVAEQLRESPVPEPPRRASAAPPPFEDLQDLRRLLDENAAARRRLDTSLVDRPTAVARVNALIDAAAERRILSDATVLGLIRETPPRHAEWLTSYAEPVPGQPAPLASGRPIAALEVATLLARLAPDAVRAMLLEQLDAAAGVGGWGESPAALHARRAELEAERFDLERAEARLITQFEAWSIFVARRADADPAAVLAIDDDPAAPAPVLSTPAPAAGGASRRRSAKRTHTADDRAGRSQYLGS